MENHYFIPRLCSKSKVLNLKIQAEIPSAQQRPKYTPTFAESHKVENLKTWQDYWDSSERQKSIKICSIGWISKVFSRGMNIWIEVDILKDGGMGQQDFQQGHMPSPACGTSWPLTLIQAGVCLAGDPVWKGTGIPDGYNMEVSQLWASASWAVLT